MAEKRSDTMRKLKFHEKKLLKKVNFLEWKREGGHREAFVMQRYHVTGRDDYKKLALVFLLFACFFSSVKLEHCKWGSGGFNFRIFISKNLI